MTRWAFLSALILASGCAALADDSAEATASIATERLIEPPVVETTAGRVRGLSDGKVASFKNIPFAAPPVGDLRWRDPRPPAAWRDIRDAAAFGPTCPQIARQGGGAGVPDEQSEDCLSLNVWRPANARRLPVMVWVHGGGHRRGSGSANLYDGTALARRGVIVVTFNYRLGLLGSFSHPSLDAESESASGNWGLADQVAALRWVRSNIEQFGGDPDRVTLFGQSAGAGSILAMLAAPSAQDLFSAAIISSPVAAALELDRESKRREVENAVSQLNLTNTEAASLRSLPASRWVEATAAISGLTMGPFTDGSLLPLSPREAFQNGVSTDAPLLIGSNANDSSVLPQFGVSLETLPTVARAEIAELDISGPGDPLTAALFAAPTHFVASAMADDTTTYLYRLDRAGGAHGYEVPFVFDNLDRLGLPKSRITQADRRFAVTLADCWVRFARDHIPVCEGFPKWPPVSRRRMLVIDDQPRLVEAPDPALVDLGIRLSLAEPVR